MSRRGDLRVLLDTSFILPSLGIEVDDSVIRGLVRLREIDAEIFYSRFSIVEALWVAANLKRKGLFDEVRFNYGLKSVFESGRYLLVSEGVEIFIRAFHMFNLGHRDMIDNILYSTAVVNGLRFLTVDRELEKFIVENDLPNVILWPD